MQMQVKKLHEAARIPLYAHPHDAGMDLFTIETITITPGERVQIRTGIAVVVPHGYVGLIWDKSGISHNAGMKILGGVIDSGYRGEILVGMINLGDTDYTFNVGDKITQMLIQKVEQPVIEEVDELDSTSRGTQGFGSTGI